MEFELRVAEPLQRDKCLHERSTEARPDTENRDGALCGDAVGSDFVFLYLQFKPSKPLGFIFGIKTVDCVFVGFLTT